MDEIKNEKPFVIETDIEAVVQKESETALRRFRSRDFASRLKARLEAPPLRRPFFLFRKPVFIPALGVFVLAAVMLILVRAPRRENARTEAGFRFITESLGRTEYFRTEGLRIVSDGPDETTTGRDISSFAAALFRVAAGSDSGIESTTPEERSAPLRPLFSPKERFKILYGDQVILKVLTNIASHKEV